MSARRDRIRVVGLIGATSLALSWVAASGYAALVVAQKSTVAIQTGSSAKEVGKLPTGQPALSSTALQAVSIAKTEQVQPVNAYVQAALASAYLNIGTTLQAGGYGKPDSKTYLAAYNMDSGIYIAIAVLEAWKNGRPNVPAAAKPGVNAPDQAAINYIAQYIVGKVDPQYAQNIKAQEVAATLASIPWKDLMGTPTKPLDPTKGSAGKDTAPKASPALVPALSVMGLIYAQMVAASLNPVQGKAGATETAKAMNGLPGKPAQPTTGKSASDYMPGPEIPHGGIGAFGPTRGEMGGAEEVINFPFGTIVISCIGGTGGGDTFDEETPNAPSEKDVCGGESNEGKNNQSIDAGTTPDGGVSSPDLYTPPDLSGSKKQVIYNTDGPDGSDGDQQSQWNRAHGLKTFGTPAAKGENPAGNPGDGLGSNPQGIKARPTEDVGVVISSHSGETGGNGGTTPHGAINGNLGTGPASTPTEEANKNNFGPDINAPGSKGPQGVIRDMGTGPASTPQGNGGNGNGQGVKNPTWTPNPMDDGGNGGGGPTICMPVSKTASSLSTSKVSATKVIK